MATSNDGTTTTSYLINFMGQRTKKSNSTDTTWFIYDENDNVIAEYDAAGNLKDEYVYLDNRPLALLRDSNLYYIYTDHLNTPRAITDTANNLQWTWENKEAFGNNAPTEVVTGFKFNFRLPGQYFDSETNLNYNIYRDYNPVWGRYMSSDPLGLAAGINTYGYVSGNGLRSSDRLGLRVLKGGDGNWKFNSSGELQTFNDGSIYEHGYFKTDHETYIWAMKYIGHNSFWPFNYKSRFEADCHGITFAKGKIWINNDQVNKFLIEEFDEKSKSDSQANDIIIFSQNNEVVHSATVINSILGVDMVKEKNGAYYGPWNWPLSWRASGQTLKYYRAKK